MARALFAAIASVALLGGCVVQDERPMVRIAAEKATREVPEDELLDVGVRLFDPNIPTEEQDRERERVFPEVRKAESRYIPVVIRDTLEGTGYWGQGLEGREPREDRLVDRDRVVELDAAMDDAVAHRGHAHVRRALAQQAQRRPQRVVVGSAGAALARQDPVGKHGTAGALHTQPGARSQAVGDPREPRRAFGARGRVERELDGGGARVEREDVVRHPGRALMPRPAGCRGA